MSEVSPTKSKFQLLALLTILIVFPLLSWYYLKTGYNYQMDSRSELKDYGTLPAFNFINKDGKPFSNDSLYKSMAVVSFFGKNEKTNQELLSIIQKLNEQFGENDYLKILIPTLQPETDTPAQLSEVFEKNNLNSERQYFLTGNKSTIQNWVGKGIKIPTEWKVIEEGKAPDILLSEDKSGNLENYPFFVLVDSKRKIRNYYHLDNVEEVKRMVEHIALLLPRDVKPDIEFEREKEK